MVPLLVRLVSGLKRHHIAALLAVAATSIVIGAALFSLTEHVSLGTGLYWAIVTAATVGYGDVIPHDSIGRLVAVGVILTTIPLLGAVFALMAGMAAVVQIRRLFGMEHGLPRGPFTLVYGAHGAALRVVEELMESGTQVVLVADLDPSGAPPEARLLAGDPTSDVVIGKSRPERAQNALVVAEDAGDVLVICASLRAAAPGLEIFALASSPKIAQALRALGVQRTLATDELVAHVLAKSLEAPHAGDVLLGLIDSERYWLTETPVPDDVAGRRLRELDLGPRSLVLGLIRDGAVHLALEDDLELRSGDTVVTVTGGGRRGAVHDPAADPAIG
jgi:voltage-gated potassium channel